MTSVKYIFSYRRCLPGTSWVFVVLIGFLLIISGLYLRPELTGLLTSVLYERQEILEDSAVRPRPDLYIEKTEGANTVVKTGQSLELTVKIVNVGSVDSGEFRVKLVDTSGWGLFETTTVSARLYKYLHLSLPVWEVHRGYHLFQLIVDSGHVVEEEREDNNAVEFGVEVR